jgi:hypothetical protein
MAVRAAATLRRASRDSEAIRRHCATPSLRSGAQHSADTGGARLRRKTMAAFRRVEAATTMTRRREWTIALGCCTVP